MSKLWVRLSLALLVMAWVGVGVMALVITRSTESSFREYLERSTTNAASTDQIVRLQDYYAENQTWDGVDALLDHRGQGTGQGQGGTRGGPVLVTDTQEQVVAATSTERIGTLLTDDERTRAAALVVDGQPVGWLVRLSPGQAALGASETIFLEEINRALVITVLVATVLALAIGTALAWVIAAPIRRLTQAVHGLSAGQRGQAVAVEGTEETRSLAQAFNQFSRQLAEGEALRKRMAADIAHELRTPVSVLRGHLEGMRDGVFPLDQNHLAVAYDQTRHLGRLVEDLRLLTLAEAGHLPLERQLTEPQALVRELVDGFQPLALDAEIDLRCSCAEDTPNVLADAGRLRQVLGNLLTNALRHTPTGGQIRVTLSRAQNQARFEVYNSGSHLTDEEAHLIFQPFWRSSASREQDSGGSGLGLAIAQQLVALHGGTLGVRPETGGVIFWFEIPGAASGSPFDPIP
jgi:signal transduction histidine kinase